MSDLNGPAGVHTGPVIDHLSINCSDVATSAAFYDRVLGVLGHRRIMDFGAAIGYGTDQPAFWIAAQPSEGPERSGPSSIAADRVARS